MKYLDSDREPWLAALLTDQQRAEGIAYHRLYWRSPNGRIAYLDFSTAKMLRDDRRAFAQYLRMMRADIRATPE